VWVQLLFPMTVLIVSIEILIATLRTPHGKVSQDPMEGICANASTSRVGDHDITARAGQR
jgi:hypothetical protein